MEQGGLDGPRRKFPLTVTVTQSLLTATECVAVRTLTRTRYQDLQCRREGKWMWRGEVVEKNPPHGLRTAGRPPSRRTGSTITPCAHVRDRQARSGHERCC